MQSNAPKASVKIAPLTPPKAIIFDWDGTIVDSLSLVNEGFNHARKAFGFAPESIEQTHENSVYGGEVIFKRDFGLEKWQEARGQFMEYFLSRHLTRFGTAEERIAQPEVCFMPGGHALMAWLMEQNFPCSVLTNRGRISVAPELNFLGYEDFLKAIVCVGEAPENKPSGVAGLFTLEKMGLTAGKDIWLVGDTFGDVTCANKAGLTSILVHKGGYENEQMPDLHVQDCHELLAVLQHYIAG